MEKKENFIVTARKWRPLRFEDVVGQQHITTTLLNAIKSDRIHHAYLFSGPRGVGKTTTARVLARAVNCLSPINSEPDNTCTVCKSIIENRSLDVIEIDGASNNSVDDVRKLRENAKYPPVAMKYKLYVIDEVHMLSTSAFNALLKTLEEPPPHLLFVFATTEIHKVPATIISRCQRFDFKRIEIPEIVSQLKDIAAGESLTIDDESLFSIAKKADGSMRDAESIFDQVIAFCGSTVNYKEMSEALNLIDQEFYFRISTAVADKNIEEMFNISREVSSKGYDLQECLNGLLEHFRNLLTISVTSDTRLINSSVVFLDKYSYEVKKFSRGQVLRILNIISNAIQTLRFAPQPGIRFELTLVQLASLDSMFDISTLLNELEELKKKFNQQPVVSRQSLVSNHKTEVGSQKTVDDSRQPSGTNRQEEYGSIKTEDKKIVYDVSEISNSKTLSEKGALPKSRIGAEELEAGWHDFLEKFGNGGNGLSILSSINPVFLDTEILFQVENNSFIIENLEKKRSLLSNLLNNHYSVNVSWKIIPLGNFSIRENMPDKEAYNTKDNVSYTNSNKDYNSKSSNDLELSKVSMDARHPVEVALIELFGAEKVK